MGSKPREIRIPIPWGGHISGKLWNAIDVPNGVDLAANENNHNTALLPPPSNHPGAKRVLCLHGWLDNANSFDPLIPLLPPDVTFLALDLPGHGLSSHLPLGLVYYFTDWLFHVHRVLAWMRWDRVTLLGHSMGAGIALLYAAAYPKVVERVISLDIMAPFTLNPNDCVQVLDQSLRTYLNYEENPAVGLKPYTMSSAMERLLEFKSLNAQTAALMLERGMRPLEPEGKGKEGGEQLYAMNRDLRLHYGAPLYYSDEQLKLFVKKMNCPLLVIIGTDSNIRGVVIKEERFQAYQELFQQILGPRFAYKEYPGTHHLHMNSPELIAPDVMEFLKKNTWI